MRFEVKLRDGSSYDLETTAPVWLDKKPPTHRCRQYKYTSFRLTRTTKARNNSSNALVEYNIVNNTLLHGLILTFRATEKRYIESWLQKFKRHTLQVDNRSPLLQLPRNPKNAQPLLCGRVGGQIHQAKHQFECAINRVNHRRAIYSDGHRCWAPESQLSRFEHAVHQIKLSAQAPQAILGIFTDGLFQIHLWRLQLPVSSSTTSQSPCSRRISWIGPFLRAPHFHQIPPGAGMHTRPNSDSRLTLATSAKWFEAVDTHIKLCHKHTSMPTRTVECINKNQVCDRANPTTEERSISTTLTFPQQVYEKRWLWLEPWQL